jgi:hypothetical protein
MLADERLWAGLVRHLADHLPQREIMTPGRACPVPVENIDHLSEPAALCHRDLVLTAPPTSRRAGKSRRGKGWNC